MNRLAAGSRAYTRGAGLWESGPWGTLSLILLALAVVALGIAIYMLIKHGKNQGKKRRQNAPEYSKHSHHPRRS